MRTAVLARTALLALALGGLAGAAQAQLFSDSEARKAIIDLRERLAASDEQARARSAELAAANAQIAEQLAATRRSLLELNNQLEVLRGEVATLRGNDEQVMRGLAEVQTRQKDVGQALDERLQKLEPAKVSLDGREFVAEPEEKAAYEEARAAIRGGDFDQAVVLLGNFQTRYPSSGYADSVRFWQGNALYGRRDHKGAIAAFRAFLIGAPDHPRAPEALLAMANSQAEMKDVRAARRTLDQLLKTYPQSEAAQAGRHRLAALK
ncbi:MAG TPA: tol-pal system protein YbgF [Rubrivivax sp.]|nr:tol-pal system protein YbgF [Rubrivivax sp.]